MHAAELNHALVRADTPASGRIVTTLYDLIESLNTQTKPDEDDLVIAAMKHIMNTQRLTFLDVPHAHRVKCA